MRGILKCLFMVLVVQMAMAWPSLAAETDSRAQSRQQEVSQMQEQIRTLERDVAVLKDNSSTRLDAQDKRIGDLSLSATQIGNHLSLLGIFIAAMAMIAGYLSWSKTKEAVQEAKREAQRSAEDWFSKREKELKEQIEALQNRVDLACQDIDGAKANVVDYATHANKIIDSAVSDVVLRPLSSKGDPSADRLAAEVVHNADKMLDGKSERDFSFEDYFARGLAEFSKSRFELALTAFESALVVRESLSHEETARLLLAKGVTLGQLARSDGQIARYDKEVAVYDLIDQRFGQDQSPVIRNLVAKALVNKGFALEGLGKSKDAIAVYDLIDRRFGLDETTDIKKCLALTFNGRAFARMQLAKQNWEKSEEQQTLLTSGLFDLDKAKALVDQANAPMVLGNLGYALFLSGDREKAEEPTRECLRLGGEEALSTQKKDAQENRVEPEDSEYEALLDRLWRELHPEDGNKTA